jgi:hypothetical protein
MNQIDNIMALADTYALIPSTTETYERCRQALRAAIEQALAVQPEQEPVKCLTCNGHGVVGGYAHDGSFDGMDCPDCNAPQPQPDHFADAGKSMEREWVGLTDEEIDGLDYLVETTGYCSDNLGVEGTKDFARAIEAKLREKNT